MRAALAALIHWFLSFNSTPIAQASPYLQRTKDESGTRVSFKRNGSCFHYFPTANESCRAASNSSRPITASFPLKPMLSTGMEKVVNLDEAVRSTSSDPCSKRGVCPFVIGEEPSRTILLPVEYGKHLHNAIKTVIMPIIPVNRSAWYT